MRTHLYVSPAAVRADGRVLTDLDVPFLWMPILGAVQIFWQAIYIPVTSIREQSLLEKMKAARLLQKLRNLKVCFLVRKIQHLILILYQIISVCPVVSYLLMTNINIILTYATMSPKQYVPFWFRDNNFVCIYFVCILYVFIIFPKCVTSPA
jgi:flagellar biosynthesis protein FlhB